MGTSGENGLIFDWAGLGPRTTAWPAHVMLDDETLRDGLQSPSVTDPPVEAKIKILHLMESLGIETLDVGLPGAGARQREAVLALFVIFYLTILRITSHACVILDTARLFAHHRVSGLQTLIAYARRPQRTSRSS